MRVILFQPQFHAAIKGGTKRSTIRKTARCKPGDELSLRQWTGKPYRSKQRVIAEKKCTKVTPIVVGKFGIELHHPDGNQTITGADDLDKFAQRDGFGAFIELEYWFQKTHGLPFSGQMIEWASRDMPAAMPIVGLLPLIKFAMPGTRKQLAKAA